MQKPLSKKDLGDGSSDSYTHRESKVIKIISFYGSSESPPRGDDPLNRFRLIGIPINGDPYS